MELVPSSQARSREEPPETPRMSQWRVWLQTSPKDQESGKVKHLPESPKRRGTFISVVFHARGTDVFKKENRITWQSFSTDVPKLNR